MGKNSPRFKSRTKHRVLLSITTGVLLAIFYMLVPDDDPRYLWSMATGYASIILLAVTLFIGPYNVLRRKLNYYSVCPYHDCASHCSITRIFYNQKKFKISNYGTPTS